MAEAPVGMDRAVAAVAENLQGSDLENGEFTAK
jgi:hypothetical protein